MNRWQVTRELCGRPVRVAVDDPTLRALALEYLEVVRGPQTRSAIEERLGRVSDCPAELVRALGMTVQAMLYAGAKGRLIEMRYVKGSGMTFEATNLGVAWLQQERAKDQERADLAAGEAEEEVWRRVY